jgi:hypothetical protein
VQVLVDALMKAADEVQCHLHWHNVAYLLPWHRRDALRRTMWYSFHLTKEVDAAQSRIYRQPNTTPQQGNVSSQARRNVLQDVAGVTTFVGQLESEKHLPPDHSLGPRAKMTPDETFNLLERYMSAFSKLKHRLQRAMPESMLVPSTSTTSASKPSPLRVPTITHKAAMDTFRKLSKGSVYPSVLSKCGIADCVHDVLHLHIHAVNNAMDHLGAVSSKYFDATGHLKSREAIAAWKMPTGRTQRVPSALRQIGFYVFDIFPKLQGRLKQSLCTGRPMKGYEGSQCCDLLQLCGIWMGALRDFLPGSAALQTAHFLNEHERCVLDIFAEWFLALFVISLVLRSTQASTHREALCHSHTIVPCHASYIQPRVGVRIAQL